jgi:hypothetical protein
MELVFSFWSEKTDILKILPVELQGQKISDTFYDLCFMSSRQDYSYMISGSGLFLCDYLSATSAWRG